MKVFCPNCGTQNEGMPGGRLTCKACTASFEVPREGGVVAQPQPPVAPPPPVMSPAPSSSPFPGGYAGPPPSGFGNSGGSGLASSGTNPLAIASLVLGILCCFPFSIAAIVTGVMAQNQINASNGMQRGRELATAGIVLGTLSLLISALGMLFSLLGRLH